MYKLNVIAQQYNEIEVPFLIDNKLKTKTPCHEIAKRCGEVIPSLSKNQKVRICYAKEDDELEDVIGKLHDKDYVDFLKDASSRMGEEEYLLEHAYAPPYIENDTPVVRNTYRQACASALTSFTAAGKIVQGERFAYALCRPPGHHAGRNFMGGYCYINNAVIAVYRLIQAGYGPVGILDMDYHFGNGTYDFVQDMEHVMFASIHASTRKEYPYYKFEEKKNCFFYEFEDEPSEENYLQAVGAALKKLAPCSVLVVSLGFDIIAGDPHGTWNLKNSIYTAIGEKLKNCGVPVCFIQEGGYSAQNIEDCMKKLIEGLFSERGGGDGLA